jgi:putative pyruvate formate lyase activating enzyme
VNRLEDKWAACKTGRYALVSYFPHFGEEDCLRGWRGSGTIFFGHCNLRCVFCQNYDISQAIRPGGSAARQTPDGHRPEAIAAMMLDLQDRGCHNINFVTPEHVVPQVIEAVAVAADRGLALPIVYNTSAYDALESIELMDGIVDLYLPDFKYWSAERSRIYLKAENYPEAARSVIEAMHRQVGRLVVDDEGLARRGLIVRHLVMPGALEETRAILQWIADTLGRETYVNLMDQYYPAGKVSAAQYPELNRRLSSREFDEARAVARELGLRRLDERLPHPRLARRIVG